MNRKEIGNRRRNNQMCNASFRLTTVMTSLARDGTIARLRNAPCSRSLKNASMILSPLFCWIDKTLQNVIGRWGYAGIPM
jgi:hypothetical protein